MIIKSMSRKEGTFRQLIEYMEREKGERAFSHNLCAGVFGRRDEIIREFEYNAARLRERQNGNALYHEVISLERGAEVRRETLIRILGDIGMEYVSRRAPNQLAYGIVHTDAEHVHLHICISANSIGKSKRERLSRAEFSTIQKEMDALVRERWAELRQTQIYGKDRPTERMRATAAEQEMKRRRGEPSRKEDVKARVHGAFARAGGGEELLALLRAAGLEIYQRGKSLGIIDQETGRRHRLSTLGVESHYAETVARLYHSGGDRNPEPGRERPNDDQAKATKRRDGAEQGRADVIDAAEKRETKAGRHHEEPLPGQDREAEERRRELGDIFRRRDRNRERER